LLKNSWRAFVFLYSLLLIGGCSTGDDTRLANEGVARFRLQLSSQQYSDIYSQADSVFRGVTKQQDFLDFMSAINRKLGKFQSASQTGYFVNWTTSGTRIRLNFASKYEGGDAQEEFLWHISGKQALLVGYHISSNSLITK
jgi:hypothetical protein